MTADRCAEPLLRVEDLVQDFRLRTGEVVQAVAGISFDVHPGETLGLVGESGCGKSTATRAILQAPRPTSGRVWFEGRDLTRCTERDLRPIRRRMQLVFQDPHASLNPRWTVRDCLVEPLQVHGVGRPAEREARAAELLDLVGLDPARHMQARPGELSGGQCQRVAIARALALDPGLVLFDEAVSALDVSIQAQILNLIGSLRRDLSLTSIFIAHDLAVVKHVSDRIGVMYLGKICELGPAESLYRSPAHPYTSALLSAIPRPDPHHPDKGQRARAAGELPSPVNPPSGCRFRTRCDRADDRCAVEEPVLAPAAGGQLVACHHPLDAPDGAPFSTIRRREPAEDRAPVRSAGAT